MGMRSLSHTELDARCLQLWGKTGRGGLETEGDPTAVAWHPLICHMIDVAVVAERLWDGVVTPAGGEWFASGIGLTHPSAPGAWIAIWAGLHDVGKASPGFQTRERYRNPPRHGVVTAVALESILIETPFELPRHVARRLARVLGGHHGAIIRSADMRLARQALDLGPCRSWADLRIGLARMLIDVLGNLPAQRPVTLDNERAMWLAGFVSVADWIGSNTAFFPLVACRNGLLEPIRLDVYLEVARRQAREALDQLGWTAWPATTQPLEFERLFPFSPNALQQEVVDLAERLKEPSLVIVEAPMGEGKTEAALYLCDRGNVERGMRGHYVALPTMATSNQMFTRVSEFLEKRYPQQVVNAQLLHGHAEMSTEMQVLRERFATYLNSLAISDDSERAFDGAPAGVVASTWFAHRKRGLLAPFGVGTVDQVLLGVLQTRHVFVRLFGLAGKTIVIDEVHAYDAYMTTLLERLLEWLAALGCSVVLLSATLPVERRGLLVDAYRNGLSSADGSIVVEFPKGSTLLPRPSAVAYPRLTWMSMGETGARTVGVSKRSTKQLAVTWFRESDSLDRGWLGERLAIALDEGGCAAVVCNTVRRAQETYLALKEFFAAEEIDLLHARYLMDDRRTRESRVLGRFGKNGAKRPDRSVLVATQIVEQSLDLDFDLLVTELAPVDLIIQRSGRLHRHPRERPSRLGTPEMWMLMPDQVDGCPRFERDVTHVYDEHVLLRSWLALRGQDIIRVPEDVEDLVEAVYGEHLECPPSAGDALRRMWDETWTGLSNRRHRDQATALRHLLLPPYVDPDGFLEDANRQLEEDDPAVHPELQAVTRLGQVSVTAVILTPREVAELMPTVPDAATRAGAFLRRSVSLAAPQVVKPLLPIASPPSWRRSALLRHCRLIELDDSGGASVGGFRISNDLELGIRISKED